ncbi:unnamed protein product [marine sediment metagenome]|uniref:Uncharacterized protein n=1 Tax=marine sediment metagenome TaxID=412755 RepID=X1SJ07_9ZZZZ
MRVDVASCGLCGAAHAGSELNPKWYAEGLRHTKRGDIVKRLICPECVSGIIDTKGIDFSEDRGAAVPAVPGPLNASDSHQGRR